ncbi:uncharacterized protein LOC134243335 [Saccostrea cucullata]|uniref:uncharacterized protein LOC134243335 n=1 Tax=Saccostrea cuccullata TaxID=36930 RepID=UPI002ED4EB74
MRFSLFWIVILYFQNSAAVEKCVKSGESTLCCADYHLVKGQCVPCPKGLFGPGCQHTCPFPSYGHRCLEGECRCPQESCTPRTGCSDPSLNRLNPVFHSDLSSKETIQKSKIGISGHNEQTTDEMKEYEENKSSSSAVIAVMSVIGVLIICLILSVIVFKLRGKIKLRVQKSTKRGSQIASHVKTYCEIDDYDVMEDEFGESETYEKIDQSQKEGLKYTSLPTRPGLSKKDRDIMSSLSMQKILEDDDKEEMETKVRLRKDKNFDATLLKRMGKTGTQVSGYIEMTKGTELEDYVPMTTDHLEPNVSEITNDET